MRYKLLDGRVIRGDEIVDLDAVTTVAVDFLSPEERTTRGITPVVEQPKPDAWLGTSIEDPAVPGAWLFMPFTPAELKLQLSTYARQRSWEIRTAGAAVNGVPVRADSESIAMVSGMVQLAQLDPTRVFNFDTGQTVARLTAQQALDYAVVIGGWVQTTFDRRAAALAAIDAGTANTTADVDALLAGGV